MNKYIQPPLKLAALLVGALVISGCTTTPKPAEQSSPLIDYNPNAQQAAIQHIETEGYAILASGCVIYMQAFSLKPNPSLLEESNSAGAAWASVINQHFNELGLSAKVIRQPTMCPASYSAEVLQSADNRVEVSDVSPVVIDETVAANDILEAALNKVNCLAERISNPYSHASCSALDENESTALSNYVDGQRYIVLSGIQARSESTGFKALKVPVFIIDAYRGALIGGLIGGIGAGFFDSKFTEASSKWISSGSNSGDVTVRASLYDTQTGQMIWSTPHEIASTRLGLRGYPQCRGVTATNTTALDAFVPLLCPEQQVKRSPMFPILDHRGQ